MIYTPQAILGVYDFLPSDEYSRSYLKKWTGSSKFYNGSEWGSRFWSQLWGGGGGGGGVKGNQQSDALVYEKHQYLNKIQKCSLNVVHMFMAFQWRMYEVVV